MLSAPRVSNGDIALTLSLFAGHRFPGLVGIVACHLPGQSGRLCAEVFFVDDSSMVHEEGLDTRNAILRGPCHQREAADHFALHHVVHRAALRIRTLRFQDVEEIAVIRDGLLALRLQ